MAENSLVIFTRAALMLAEADTIQKAKELKTLALTAGEWAKRKGMGEQAIQHCRSYAMEAERKMGEMCKAEADAGNLATRESNPGTLSGKTSSGVPARHTRTATTSDIGLTRKERSQAEQLAALPRAVFDEVRDGKKTRTQVRRDIVRQEIIKRVSLPTAKYRVIYADPPWSYGNTQPDYHTEQRDHYPVMKLSEICSMPVASFCEDNAVLFLWVTSPILEESFEVIRDWGFKYKASFVWDKIKHNMGHYNSVRHEFLLICVRGSCQPDTPKLIDSVQSIERTEHSAKPEEFRRIIEELYPHGKRLEMFARGKHVGWDTYGNQA